MKQVSHFSRVKSRSWQKSMFSIQTRPSWQDSIAIFVICLVNLSHSLHEAPAMNCGNLRNARYLCWKHRLNSVRCPLIYFVLPVPLTIFLSAVQPHGGVFIIGSLFVVEGDSWDDPGSALSYSLLPFLKLVYTAWIVLAGSGSSFVFLARWTRPWIDKNANSKSFFPARACCWNGTARSRSVTFTPVASAAAE